MSTTILEKPIKKVMLSMMAPAAFGMLITFMFQLVDTYFIGKLGTKELAAISFAYPVYSIVIGLFIGISFPTFGLSLITTSIFNGVYKPNDSMRLILVKALVLTIPLAIIGALFSVNGIWLGLALANFSGAIYAIRLLERWLQNNNSSLAGQNRLLPYVKDFKYLLNKISS